jgi:hypothetical protein
MERNPHDRKLARFIPVFIPISLLSQIVLTGFSTSKHDFVYPVVVYEKITVDAYGALLPFALSILFVVLYFAYFKGSFLRMLGSFLFAFAASAVSFKFAISDNGGVELKNYLVILAILISIAVIFLIMFDENALKTRTLLSSVSSRIGRNYVVALLVSFSVSAVSAFSMDLVFAPFLNQEPLVTSVNIGGGGLTDGVLLSGVFALVWTTFFISVLALLIEILRISHREEKTSEMDD